MSAHELAMTMVREVLYNTGITATMAVAGETTAAVAASSPLRWWSCWCFSPWEAEGIPTVQGCLRQANYDIKAIFCCFDARTVRACQEKP